MGFLLGLLLTLTSIFLILLVLVQRGRGGGLAGALGGMGGQSAFGAKAGDVFTRVTVVTATIWILLCVASVRLIGTAGDRLEVEADSLPGGVRSTPATDSATPGAMGGAAATPASPAPATEAPASTEN